MKNKFLLKILFITISISFVSFCFGQEKSIVDVIKDIKDIICPQVITPAKNPVTGECKEFPTPCDVPPEWIKVKSCTGSIVTVEPEEKAKEPIVCKEYFWYDESNLECQGPKTFCGAFMYKGLHVFESKEECEKSLIENPKFKERKKEEIKREIKEKDEISMEDIAKIVGKINFLKGSVEIDDEKIDLEKEKVFTKKVGERELKILINPEKIDIKDGEIWAKVEGALSIENEKLLIEGKEIKITPHQILEKLKIQNPLSLEIKLKLEGENAVYWLKAIEKRKILGIFPIKIQKEVEILAQKEEIEKIKETKRPWWSFLVF